MAYHFCILIFIIFSYINFVFTTAFHSCFLTKKNEIQKRTTNQIQTKPKKKKKTEKINANLTVADNQIFQRQQQQEMTNSITFPFVHGV